MDAVAAIENVPALLGLVRLVDEEEAAKLGPGLIAFTIVVLLAVATFFLIRSMMYHINKVPPTFDRPDDDTATDDTAGDETAEGEERSDPGVGER
jgi:hypothetical protein